VIFGEGKSVSGGGDNGNERGDEGDNQQFSQLHGPRLARPERGRFFFGRPPSRPLARDDAALRFEVIAPRHAGQKVTRLTRG